MDEATNMSIEDRLKRVEALVPLLLSYCSLQDMLIGRVMAGLSDQLSDNEKKILLRVSLNSMMITKQRMQPTPNYIAAILKQTEEDLRPLLHDHSKTETFMNKDNNP